MKLLAILAIMTFTVVLSLVVRLADRRFQRGQSIQPFPIASCVLMAVAVWTIGIVSFVGFVPGGFGPVQYAANSPMAMFVFHLRVATMLAMLAAPVLAALIGSARLFFLQQIRLGWVLAGVTCYGIAWAVLFANSWFAPSV